jgi:uncharacterized OB-fold protein
MTGIAQSFPAVDPALQPEEVPFWDGLAVGELRVPWCAHCDTHVWRPKSHCTTCFRPVQEWRTLEGTGIVYSFSVVHRAEGAFVDVAPYVLAWIELDGGPTILADVVAPDLGQVVVGAPVRLVPRAGDGVRVGPVFSVE